MVKIALLTDCLQNLHGGAEKQIFELAKGLLTQGFQVTIISLECEGCAPKDIIEKAGINLVIFPVKKIYSPAGIMRGIRFKEYLQKEKIDILLTYHFSSDIWGTFFARMAGVKTIISNRRDMGFWRGPQHVIAYMAINHWVDKIVVVADSIKKMVVISERVAEEKIMVIHNGVEVPQDDMEIHKTKDLKYLPEVDNSDIVIMHVANLRPVKGHKYLISALAELVPIYPDIKLILVGEDKTDTEIHKQVIDLGIERHVIFLGKRDNVSTLLKMADICVMPSLSEGMSNAILEYMAAGKPVIATDVGGNSELVENNKTGLLIEKENVAQLKDAILFLINHPKKRIEMGKAGYLKTLREFSMQKMISKYIDLFNRYIS